MLPIVHRLEAEHWDRIDFVYLDREAEANSDVVKKYSIAGQPIFILVTPDGTEVQRWFGSPDPNDLREALDAYLAG